MHRHYGMDWLRIGAFQLLILYHVGMAFVAWDFPVKVSPPIDWVAIPMLMINPWRLSLLFVVSGYASAGLFAKDRRVGGFLRARVARLGLPLLFGMLVVVVPQPWVQVVTHYGYSHGFGWFVLHDYYRFQSIGPVAVPTWMQLWFVVYLFAYTLVLGALLVVPGGWRYAVRRLGQRVLAGPALLPLPIVGVFLARRWLAPGWSENHALWGDWSAHATYLPCFLFGYALAGSTALRATIGRQWRIAGLAAIGGCLILGGCEWSYPGAMPLPASLHLPFDLARATAMWGAIVGLIGLAERHGNHDGRWRATLTEAVFPFYLVHQTIIVVVGYWLLPTATGPVERFVILVAATAGGCWAFYLLGRRIAWLRPLIGLKRVASPRLSATAVPHDMVADDPRWRGPHPARAHRA